MNDPVSFDVVTIGEPLVLFAAEEAGALSKVERFRRYCAGAELNVAVGLARLGFHVGYLGRVGADSFGEFLLAAMADERIDSRLVSVDPARPTGFMLKSREVDGSDPRAEYYRRGSAASAMDREDLARFGQARARLLHLTGISPALSPGCRELVFEAARLARGLGMLLSFDPNLRPRLWDSTQEMTRTVNELASLCDVVLPGLEEGRTLTGSADPESIGHFYLDRGVPNVVVKLGARGAWCAGRGVAPRQVPGVAVERVVDTVGAGDGFAVGVVSGLLEGLDLPQAAMRGNAIGARVVQFPGDSDGLPRREDLRLP